ncbi:tigger transposable element-derived protein 6-like [Phytophthora cinnamomi]|uniref:tigger transposable element-derived protein 6-like n=1 Tax=Phytophthora cinnamomi TaxID=4785 RepID=UPI00355AB016|nr:tigger transposable element-derived protein 6-like [Phytophthora cinnamomi]
MATPAATKPKRSRSSFTNAQRLEICNYREQNPTLTQSQLASWAQEALALPRKPSQAMISKLLKRKNDLETMTIEELTSKSRRTVRFPNLDTALARWVAYCEETGVSVTGESIRAKAMRFAAILHIDTPLSFSNGWLYKFNERHGFGGLRAHKDSKSSVETAVLDLQRRLQSYSPRDIFSMDETGLFFTMYPDRSGRRMTKRVTVVLSCNADGSEKLPPLFIGKAEKPRGFTSSTAAEMNYVCNSSTLMTRELFNKWLKDADARFAQQQRKCIVLIDAVAVHAGFNVDELRNVEVALIPSGTEANLQPLVVGIVPAFKRRYRRRQIQHALDQVDADADMSTAAKFDTVGVKQAMTWCIECWDAVPSAVIVKSWQETGLLHVNGNLANEFRGEEDAISEELAVMLSWLHATDPMTVEELLGLPEENIIMEEPTDEDFCAPVESVRVAIPHVKPKLSGDDGGLSAEELKERLKWIAKLLIYADEKGVPADSVSGMRILQRDFRDQLNKKQGGSS